MSRTNKFLTWAVEAATSAVRPALMRVLLRQASDIPLERQRRALASTVDYVQQHMRYVPTAASQFELLDRAFAQADTSGDRLICEFGVFKGGTINHIAKMTPKIVFGFDSFEWLPEDWEGTVMKGYFALKELPLVANNVSLVKGWFNQTLPNFLTMQSGAAAFVHIDCDLYSSTKTVFDLLRPRLVPGTVIVFDEYFNYPGWEEGEHKAFSEFLSSSGLQCEFIGYVLNGQQVAVVLKK